jgi:shikimate kinase
MPLPPTIRRILLIGFMGAGKSTAGELLASALGWRFVDTDTVIVARAGRSVAEIFAAHGESAFRALEADVIREHAASEGLVMALGGGAVEDARTRQILHSMAGSRIVFLEAPLEVMVARCAAQPHAAERPVLADGERLLQRFTQRLPHYRNAHLTVNTANLTPPMVVERILWGLSEARDAVQEDAERGEARGLPTR